MPGPIVSEPLVRLIAPSDVPAVGRAQAGQRIGQGATPVAGAGLSVASSDFWTPPATWMLAAAIDASPETEIARVELESTTTTPGMSMLAFPERVRRAGGRRVEHEDRRGHDHLQARRAPAAGGVRDGQKHRVGSVDVRREGECRAGTRLVRVAVLGHGPGESERVTRTGTGDRARERNRAAFHGEGRGAADRNLVGVQRQAAGVEDRIKE